MREKVILSLDYFFHAVLFKVHLCLIYNATLVFVRDKLSLFVQCLKCFHLYGKISSFINDVTLVYGFHHICMD